MNISISKSYRARPE